MFVTARPDRGWRRVWLASASMLIAAVMLVDDANGATRSRPRSDPVWEVHLILEDGRRQIYRGVREPGGGRRVLKLRVEGAAVERRSGGTQGGGKPPVSVGQSPVERIEGGYVAPKPYRRGDPATVR